MFDIAAIIVAVLIFLGILLKEGTEVESRPPTQEIVYQVDREKTDFSYRLHFLQERLDSIASQENQTSSPQRT